MPWALSVTGPKVSIATITPTVVSSPQPASAIANRPVTPAPPSRNAPNTAAAITSAVNTADSSPSEKPESTTVAAPVREVAATCRTGRSSVEV